jgi:hypothetical protein
LRRTPQQLLAKSSLPMRPWSTVSRREREREQRERKREQEGIDKKAERNRKEKEKAFERLISLPSGQHQTRLAELAKRFDEDVAVIRDDFTAFAKGVPRNRPAMGTLPAG